MVPLNRAIGLLLGHAQDLTIVSHHRNNYAGAVRNLGKLETELASTGKGTSSFVVAALRQRELTLPHSKSLRQAAVGSCCHATARWSIAASGQ